MNFDLIGDAERFYIIRGIQTGIRPDGRKLDDFRRIDIEVGFLNHVNASSRINIGQTQVVCTIKLEVGKPDFLTPNKGKIVFNTEWSPIATPNLQKRTAKEMGNNLNSFFHPETGLCVNDFIALDRLSIRTGTQCWIINVDFIVLVDCGNVLDAASLAFKSAFSNLKLPYTLESTLGSNALVNISLIPIYITVLKIGNTFIADPSDEEESCSLASIFLGVRSDGSCISLQSTGCGSISVPSYKQMVSMCLKLGLEMHECLEKALNMDKEIKDIK